MEVNSKQEKRESKDIAIIIYWEKNGQIHIKIS